MNTKFLLPVFCLAASTAFSAEPARLKRADSFLGIHFDFHAGPDCKEVGKNTTPQMVERIIDLVHPDYLQIDCKGHPGYSSYPTKVGHPVPGFVGDPLKVWREVTARRGVALYMHYSGVWDSKAVAEHPDWAVTNGDGKQNAKATSTFGPYADRLLIPQLRELAGDYGVDGVWADGECWAAAIDYCPAALAAFQKETGLATAPRKPADPHWFDWLQFQREAYRRYLRRYIAEVKKTNPNFQICSNWAFTDHMPEAVCAPVDFLSGDYSPDNSVNSARLSARFLARQGKPWDLMAWSFSRQQNHAQKTAPQLQREAAIVLAEGGGFQAYYKQKRDGSIFDEQMPVMAEVAKFCRARQAICHHAEAVPQIGLILSTADHYRRMNGLFGRDHTRIEGILQALLESQHCVEVLAEHQLTGRFAQYPLLIVPECAYLEPAFVKSLVEYAKNGGTLLVIGPASAKLFETELGALVPAGAKPAVTNKSLGNGRIAAIDSEIGANYKKNRSPELRQFLSGVVRDLFPNPLVTVKNSADVDVSVARNHGKLLVNLVNTAGPHQTAGILDQIPPVGPLEVTVRVEQKPASVTLEPGARPVPFEFKDGQIKLTVPKLEIHDIIVIE